MSRSRGQSAANEVDAWEKRRQAQAEAAERGGDYVASYATTLAATVEGAVLALRRAGLDLEADLIALKASGGLKPSALRPLVEKARAYILQQPVSDDLQAGLNGLEATYGVASVLSELNFAVQANLRQPSYALLLSAHKCGAAEAMLAYVRQGFADDALARSKSRTKQRETQGNTARDRVDAWYPKAILIGRGLCEVNPAVSSKKIARAIKCDATNKTPGADQVYDTVLAWRIDGTLPPKPSSKEKGGS